MRVRKLALVAAIIVSGFAGYASADQPGPDWMTKDQVMQKLSAAGYNNITGLEADDGHWEGKGTKNGKIVEFHVDPHTGALTKEEIDD
ncbi:MAG: PepSY domain-containing protein [Proteobacteria bacterium]|nr:PepSY domain-containing protein [Pseudomonadota bacterium]